MGLENVAAGRPGPQGAPGVQGPTGATGATGSQGIQGPTGPAGPRDYFTVDPFSGVSNGDCSLFVSNSCTSSLGATPSGATFPATVTLNQVALSSPAFQLGSLVDLVVGGSVVSSNTCFLSPNRPCTITPITPVSISAGTSVYLELPGVDGEVDVVANITAVTLP
jgi:hypothetical protein